MSRPPARRDLAGPAARHVPDPSDPETTMTVFATGRRRRLSVLVSAVATVWYLARCLLSAVFLAIGALGVVLLLVLWSLGVVGLGVPAYAATIVAIAAATWLSFMLWPDDPPARTGPAAAVPYVPGIGQPAPWDAEAAALERLYKAQSRRPPHDYPLRPAAPGPNPPPGPDGSGHG